MPHFVSSNLQQRRQYSSSSYFYCSVLLFLLFISFPALAEETASDEKTLVMGLSAISSDKNLEIAIKCSGRADFIPIELSNPSKIVIDIADAAISPGTELVLSPDSYGIEVASKLIKDVSPELVRVEFILTKKYNYKVEWSENDLILTLENFFTEQQAEPEKKETPVTSVPKSKSTKEEDVKEDTIDRHLPDLSNMSEVPSSVADGKAGTGNEQAGEQAGSETQGTAPRVIGDDETISVDFYKIDLHNVFRMLREVTGKNIVIAEGVSGNLTLALTDVPWRFALDIILNLKDLAQMERENTIVIYPKDQEFVWPEKEEDISIEFNDDVISQEAIIIKQEKQIPPERIEAKKIIANGRAAEKKGDLETAVRFYERALTQWPENSKLANKISTTYLARLNQNAKAVFYAKKALEADKKNAAAALNAAIGYANMEEFRQAQQYFEQSVNTSKPSREALMSYAAFSERQTQYDAALRLLKKLEELYGQDLNSMVAQARIYDSVGDYGAARKKYKAILHAGFRVPPDLKAFILSKVGKR
jgi:type IV pilus assembly protein PilQ